MKSICAILSIVGIYWAYVASLSYMHLFLVLTGDFISYNHAVYSVLMVVLATVGYWIWSGWIIRVFKGRYHWVSPRVFWSISIAHHASWLLWMNMESGPGIDADGMGFMVWWCIGLVAISSFGLVGEWDNPRPRKIKAEQVVVE
ncbi:MAG: hypothetical protein ACI9FG_001370 [Crocinitomicaceae bacterium]|jgi:hypothetical protein